MKYIFKAKKNWRRSIVFIVNFEHISQLFLTFLLLTLKKKIFAGTYYLWHEIELYE